VKTLQTSTAAEGVKRATVLTTSPIDQDRRVWITATKVVRGAVAPWHIVRADDKRLARLNPMRDILSRLHYVGRKSKLVQPDRNVAFLFTPECIDAKRLAR
jgi:hypothetical protein